MLLPALFMEAFISIHMSIFVLLPLSKIFSREDSDKLFWKLFLIRVVILLFFDFFITPLIAIVDFFGVFVGAFLVVPISLVFQRKKVAKNVNQLKYNIKNNMDIPPSAVSSNDTSPVIKIDEEYLNSENVLMRNIIKKEIENQGENPKTLITSELNSKKNLAIFVFGVLTALFVLMYKYYKYPLYISIFGEIVSIIVFFVLMSKYNMVNVIYEYSKKNPDSEIFQIVTSVRDKKKFDVIPDYIKIITILLVAIIIPILWVSQV